jgi:serine/threonine-protein kinase HipA
MGSLFAEKSRGNEIFSFEYSHDWLSSKHSRILDPDLRLFPGPQYLTDDKPNYGLFLDSSPDRWGRLLMQRREAALAKLEHREVRTLQETDFLLGVYDGHRMGALRFKKDPDGPFLNDNVEYASPPWTSIGDLEKISLMVESGDEVDNPEYLHWISQLVNPGSSLGGARPKAGVLDDNNHLWIAKFPSLNDDKDMGAWEMVVSRLARQAGISMPEAKLQKFMGRHHTFISKRFDRSSSGERIHFASAMTLLGYKDGTDFTDGASYLDLASFIIANGGRVNTDLEELWRRIVFSIFVSNTDDHLRNHGFILTNEGWVLSPAYDINPNESGTGLTLNISENDNSLDPELAMSVIPYFRLSEKKAIKIMEQIKTVVSSWNKVAASVGISRSGQEMMRNAFK